jgi:signal transduction histidine kinase
MSRLLSAPLLVLALGEIASSASVRAPLPFSLDGSALTMAAGLLFALSGAYVLLTALSVQGATAFRLQGLLRNLEQYRAREEERTHDARAALLAVQTAITALTRYRERLDDQSRNNLEVAVDAELERLLGLMSTPAQPPAEAAAAPGEGLGPFDVVGAVTAVTTAASTFGLRIAVRLDDVHDGVWALGSRDDTARVLETLLDNARRYAPGSPITVCVGAAGETVRVAVADRGPGIAPDERDLVFRRGARGRTSRGTPGTGLGLFAARRLMDDQGGALALATYGPGATFVLTLPAASRAVAPIRPDPRIGARAPAVDAP